MINTCWKCERIVFGVKGLASGSWNTAAAGDEQQWKLQLRQVMTIETVACTRTYSYNVVSNVTLPQ